jgi:hypothetical protein
MTGKIIGGLVAISALAPQLAAAAILPTGVAITLEAIPGARLESLDPPLSAPWRYTATLPAALTPLNLPIPPHRPLHRTADAGCLTPVPRDVGWWNVAMTGQDRIFPARTGSTPSASMPHCGPACAATVPPAPPARRPDESRGTAGGVMRRMTRMRHRSMLIPLDRKRFFTT